MTQDWSQPFFLDAIKDLPGLCVYCPTEEDGEILYNTLRDSGVSVRDFAATWKPAYPCYRFSGGAMCNRGSIQAYEEGPWRPLPKFTFVAPRIELQELEIPDSCALF